MTPEQWQRLKALFNGALEQPRDTRDDWLNQHAGGDEMLAREASALLQSHETVDGFLDKPASVDLADFLGIDEPRAGVTVGAYEIEYEIGRGGMGIVYCARDTRLGRRVALKALPPLHDENAGLRERLRREARAAATISHPAVATVYALEEIEGRLFIASEYIEGHPLRAEIERGPFMPARALAIAADITRALVAAHAAGVIHRDLKPENVLITLTGAVKVVDFGIAHAEGIETRLTRPGDAIGTPAYMAPEQVVGGPVDARVDIYALGVVLTEMLTGQHPLVPGRRSMPAAAEIVSRCLQANPEHRYPSAQELLAAIEEIIRNPKAAAHASPVSAASSSSRWWWEFHQAAMAVVYAVMVWPTWMARSVIGAREGDAVFIATLAAAIVAVTLRLHLWFTARFYPAELRWARARAAGWTLAADGTFAMALIAAGGLVGDRRPVLAVLEIAVGIATATAFALVEPATTRAAFRTGDGPVDSSRP